MRSAEHPLPALQMLLLQLSALVCRTAGGASGVAAAAAAGTTYVGPLPCTDASCPAGANCTDFHVRDVSIGPGGDGYYCELAHAVALPVACHAESDSGAALVWWLKTSQARPPARMRTRPMCGGSSACGAARRSLLAALPAGTWSTISLATARSAARRARLAPAGCPTSLVSATASGRAPTALWSGRQSSTTCH